MATRPRIVPPVRYADKKELLRLWDEIDRRNGFVPDPDATIEKLREMLRTEGIRPEENAFSREIIRMRYGDEEE